MSITTVAGFWSDQATRAKASINDTQQALTAALTALTAARDAVAAANKALAALNDGAAEIRAKLAVAATKADVDALGLQLMEVTRDIRKTQAETIDAEAAVRAASSGFDVANAALSAAVARLSVASAAKASAEQAEKERTELTDRLTKPPLDTIEADAAAALTQQPYTDAQGRIEADLPPALRDCAAESAAVVFGRLANDATLVAQTAALAGAIAPAVENRRRVFEQADAHLRDHVVNATARLEQALALASRVADPKHAELTDPERRSIFSRQPDGSADTQLEQDRGEAAGARIKLATAQIDLDAKTTALAVARAQARAADIDADPEADAAVGTARDDVTDALSTRDQASNDLTAEMRTTLGEWQLAVPDGTWRHLADFDAATRRLHALAASHAALTTNLTTAESDYVTALIAADKAARTAASIDRDVAAALSQRESDAAAASNRVLGALRGDS